jgi:hypothetical protein
MIVLFLILCLWVLISSAFLGAVGFMAKRPTPPSDELPFSANLSVARQETRRLEDEPSFFSN